MQRILIHICCGPCAVYPLKRILDGKPAPEGFNQGMDVWGFFYNPNIHPYTEFEKRLAAVKTLADKMALKMLYKDEYNLEEFLQNTIGRGLKSVSDKNERCGYCYSSRLEATAQAAKENNFDYFSSSLLYSRYQGHEVLKKLGFELADKYGIQFFYDDFRIGWKEGIKESKVMGLYRQKYCGCIFSEKERYAR